MFRARYIPPAPEPEPKPVSQLTRVEIAARIHVLREALEILWVQSGADGGMPFDCIGSMKKSLYWLEERLHELDRAAGLPFAAAVNDPAACARVRAADLNRKECERGLTDQEHAELSALLRTIAVAGPIGMAGGAR